MATGCCATSAPSSPSGIYPGHRFFFLLSARHKDPCIALYLEAPELGTVAIPRLGLRVQDKMEGTPRLSHSSLGTFVLGLRTSLKGSRFPASHLFPPLLGRSR